MPNEITKSERTIDGDVFTVEPMLAMRSFALQARLAPAFFEAAATIAQVVGDDPKSIGDLNLEALAQYAPRLGAVFARMPPGEFEAIVRELLASATMNGAPLFARVQGDGDPFQTLMRGRTLQTWKLLWFALEVHYPDFFASVRALGVKSKAAGASATSSTSAPAGRSGAAS